mmetsp:Transcript_1378/g.2891  ORF Transcript_1378/g.2891 Transcript_1378/m.2891 type:complete len:568 (-) Transcript_1378:190-1893(-)
MHPYVDNDNDPAYSPTRFPPTVVFKHVKHHRGATISSSEGTGTTYIETSPLSTEQYSPVNTVHHSHKQKPNHHRYNGSHHRPAAISTKKKNRKNESDHHESNHFRYSSVNHNEQREANDERQDPSKFTSEFSLEHREHKKHTQTSELTRHNETLIWRMDPSISLSDLTLTIVGINDKNAIEKYLGAKKQKKKQSKRRDTWIVDGLYLDISQSAEDDESVEDCRNTIDDKYHGQEHRSDVHVHSTISGTKASTYPVVEKYYLHKVNLAVGMRSCDYFARLFQKKCTSNNSNHSIELPLSCLPAIPAMLDYLYHPDPMTPIHATTATAIPLRYLGALLGNRSLFESATSFLHMDLRPKTAIEYLQHAELYHQKKLAEVCIRVIAQSFDQLKITWFASLAPTLMKKILHSRHFTRSIDSNTVCSKIASYCRCQLHKIDRATLLSLTSTKVMPVVCQEEALFFIQIMIRLGMDTEDRSHDDCISYKERSLYERCIDAAPMVVQGVIDSLSQDNNAVDMKLPHGSRRRPSRQTKNACGDYSRLPPQIKVDLLEYALAKQQKKDVSADICYDR